MFLIYIYINLFLPNFGLKSVDSVRPQVFHQPIQEAGATIEVAKVTRKFHQFPRGNTTGNRMKNSMDWFCWENLNTGNQSYFPIKYGAFRLSCIRRPRQTQGGVRKGKRVYDTAARKE